MLCTLRSEIGAALVDAIRGPAGPGIVPGSGSDPSVIFGAGIRIPAVLGTVRIKLVVSRRIRAELRSAGPNMQHPGYYK